MTVSALSDAPLGSLIRVDNSGLSVTGHASAPGSGDASLNADEGMSALAAALLEKDAKPAKPEAAPIISGERRLCACGCGEQVGPDATWRNGAHANKGKAVRRASTATAARVARGEDIDGFSRDHTESLRSEMRSTCIRCGRVETGLAGIVLDAMHAHRTDCADW